MLYGRCLRFALSLIPAAALLSTATARPQSVAEAARRVREQKKNSKPARVITEDDLYRKPVRPDEAVNVIGSEPKQSPASGGTLAPAAPADKVAGRKLREAAKLTDEIARVKEKVDSAQKDLDLLQRQLALDSEAFYSQTGFASDASGQAKLDNEKQQISDKQQELDNLKSHLATLEEELARTKPEAPEATPPPPANSPTTSAPPAPARPSQPM